MVLQKFVTAIRNKSYWNYNNLNPKDPVALNLFLQKDLIDAIEKAERRIKREKRKRKVAMRNNYKFSNKIDINYKSDNYSFFWRYLLRLK